MKKIKNILLLATVVLASSFMSKVSALHMGMCDSIKKNPNTSKIQFAYYKETGKVLKWRVVNNDGTYLTLLSDEAVESVSYGNVLNWLKEFVNCFSKTEKSALKSSYYPWIKSEIDPVLSYINPYGTLTKNNSPVVLPSFEEMKDFDS
ncbi:hypothetical protein FACS189465_0870 [Clostridia bacterium]|nr:hypothetical protein FACS189465_0870 [Clostridia bacterium]